MMIRYHSARKMKCAIPVCRPRNTRKQVLCLCVCHLTHTLLPLSPVATGRHPYVTFFHLFFRGASIVIYMFCGWFSDSFITSFVFVVLFLSADFWTVKNISGRLLVGLRWWNYVDDDGKSHWVFESKNVSYSQSHTLETDCKR